VFTRRHFIAGAAATAFAAPAILRAQSAFRTYPFTLGIAAGDPSPDGFVIWTRLAPEPLAEHGGMVMEAMPVTWEVAADDRFADIAARGEAVARPELGHSVHVEVAGLLPDRPYWYRFRAGGERSFNGRARTLPAAASSPQALRFGVCGCQAYDDGYYTAYDHLAREDLAFALSVILLGLLLMVTRRNAVSQVVGFMSLENGLVLAATGAKGMPLVVEISIAFSILIAFIVIGIFLFRIRERFDTVDLQALDRFRGERR